MESDYDVLVIGGGPAGLGAAMALGRMSRRALICDDDHPRNAPAEHMNNFPSRDGTSPTEWRRLVRKDLEKYETVHFYKGSVLSVERDGSHFLTTISSGKIMRSKKVILAYGVLDKLPSIPGARELWGKSIFHCPYCHGFEVRGTRLGLIANGDLAEHLTPMIYSLSKDLILFTNGPSHIKSDFKDHLKMNNVKVIEDEIRLLEHEGTKLKTVVLKDGETFERDGLFLAPSLPFQSKSSIGESLGCEKNEMGLYKVNPMGKTTADGVFAAGDIMIAAHSVLNAAAAGQMAGAGAVFELLNEEFRHNFHKSSQK